MQCYVCRCMQAIRAGTLSDPMHLPKQTWQYQMLCLHQHHLPAALLWCLNCGRMCSCVHLNLADCSGACKSGQSRVAEPLQQVGSLKRVLTLLAQALVVAFALRYALPSACPAHCACFAFALLHVSAQVDAHLQVACESNAKHQLK